MQFRKTSSPLLPSMDLTPLVDMLFILNIFLMMQTRFYCAPAGLEVDLPQAKTGEGQIARETQSITVDRDNRIFLGKEAVSLEKLRARLTGINRDCPVMLNADRASAYGTAIAVFDLLRELKFPRVTLNTYQKPGKEAAGGN